jgi:hypothetical protein
MYKVMERAERAQVTADKGDVGVVLESCDADTKVVGQQAIVCVKEGDELATRHGQPQVPGR